jgi:hypothetical protein
VEVARTADSTTMEEWIVDAHIAVNCNADQAKRK